MDEPGERIWRFAEPQAFEDTTKIFEDANLRLKNAGILGARHSTMVSYSLRSDDELWLDSYELHAAYTGGFTDRGDPEVDKLYVRNSYRIISTEAGVGWVAESMGESITEDEFYRMALYDQPDRVISLQQLSFESRGSQYLVELNVQAKCLVLISLSGEDRVPGALMDMVSPGELSRSEYLLELFEHNGGPLNT